MHIHHAQTRIAYNGQHVDRGGSPLFAALVTGLNSAGSLFHRLSVAPSVQLALGSQNGLRHYLKAMQSTDQTFKGLYHWNAFDAALLLPYFAVMILLAVYGIHRYTLCYQYFRYRKNYHPDAPNHFDELPMVTVQLPIFNEQFVIDRLLEAVCAMEYPR